MNRHGATLIVASVLLAGACSDRSAPSTTAVAPPPGSTSGTESTTPTAMGVPAPSTASTATSTTTATTLATDLGPGALIGIRTVGGVAEFYEVASGDRWVPRGTNLVRTDTGQAESPLSQNSFDKAWIEERLDAMEDLGFNTVRVMLEICETEHCVAGANERVAPQFLDNAVEFLEMAAARGIHVMYTSNDLPADSWYTRQAFVEGESDFLTSRNVEVYTEYFTDVVEGLIARDAPLDWLWSLEIRNEYVYQSDTPPWSADAGSFVAANGQSYDMAAPSDRTALSSELLEHWADAMTSTIKTIRPETLVSIGLLAAHDNITPFGEGDPRWLIVGDFHANTDVDFFDIHGARASVEVAMERYNLHDLDTKPVIVGEFGAANAFAGSIDIGALLVSSWQTVSCRGGFDGWLTWHWTGTPGERWPIEGTVLGEVLSPKLHPDACADVDVEIEQVSWRRPVVASATEDERYLASNLTDSNPESYWSAGAGTPQWFEIDFGEPVALGTFRLPIGIVTPDGPVRIDVHGTGPEHPEPVLLHTFDTTMAPGDVLEHTLETPVMGIQIVRFTIRTMRDWVIFHDVEVFRAAD